MSLRIFRKYSLTIPMLLGILWSSNSVVYAQSSVDDSASSTPRAAHAPVYKVNYWITGGIIAAGGVAGYLLPSGKKSNIDSASLASLNPNNVPGIDQWSMHQDPSLVPKYDDYSRYLELGMVAAPLTLLFDGAIRHDWVDILLMGLEVNMVEVAIYGVTPLGPSFQTRYRPVIYYPTAPVNRVDGNQKNSFYSGHVASSAAASFFMAKVYSDYHPELGADKWWLYGAAAVPPLVMGYFRLMSLNHFPSDVLAGIGIGTLCGVLIPELHRISTKDVSMGVYSSPQGTGLTIHWTPPVTASK